MPDLGTDTIRPVAALPAESSRLKRLMEGAQVPLLLALFLAFYLYASFHRPPWHDELVTLYLHSEPLSKFIPNLRIDSFTPLYYLLTHFWGLLFGYEIWTLRLLSTFLILGSALVLRDLLRRLDASPGTFWTLLIFLLHPFSFYYAIEARAYALLLFLALLVLHQALTGKNPYILTLSVTLLLYVHNLCVLFIPPLLLLPVLARDRRLYFPILAALLLYLPYVPILIAQPPGGVAWMQWKLTLLEAFDFFGNLFPQAAGQPPVIPRLTEVFAFVNLGFIGVALFGKKELRLCALAVLGIYAMFIVISTWIVRIYAPFRGEMLVMPFFFVILFAMLWRLPSGARFAACGLVVLFLTVQDVQWIGRMKHATGNAMVAAQVGRHVRSGDRVFVPGPWFLSLRYYLEQEGIFPQFVVVPGDQAVHPGWYDCKTIDEREFQQIAVTLQKPEAARSFAFWLPTRDCANQFEQRLGPQIRPVFRFGQVRFGIFKTQPREKQP